MAVRDELGAELSKFKVKLSTPFDKEREFVGVVSYKNQKFEISCYCFFRGPVQPKITRNHD